jgi:hypothetical protein
MINDNEDFSKTIGLLSKIIYNQSIEISDLKEQIKTLTEANKKMQYELDEPKRRDKYMKE